MPDKDFCYSCGQPPEKIEGGFRRLRLSGVESATTIRATPYIHCLVIEKSCAEITLIGNFGVIFADKYRIGPFPEEEDIDNHVHHIAFLTENANVGLIIGKKLF